MVENIVGSSLKSERVNRRNSKPSKGAIGWTSSQRKECKGLSVLTSTATRRIPAAASLKNFHPLVGEFSAIHRDPGHVAAGMSDAPCKSQCYWVGNQCQDDGNGRGLPFQCERCWGTSEDDGNGIEAYQLLRKLVVRLGLTERESVFDREVLTLDVTKIPEPSSQCLNEVGETGRREIAKTHHALLRPRPERPRGRAAEQRDELAALHSITSSARASRVGGTSRPSALAVFRLITSSKLVGCCTGRSAGLAPFKIRPT